MNVADLNSQAQAAIASVLANGVTLEASVLVDRIMALGYKYRPYVLGIVSRAYIGGMLERVGTKPKQYRLADGWEGDLSQPIDRKAHQDQLRAQARLRNQRVRVRPQVHSERPRETVATAAYYGPVFDRPALAPALGVICVSQEEREDELPPHMGARLVNSLHDHFDRIFQNVE